MPTIARGSVRRWAGPLVLAGVGLLSVAACLRVGDVEPETSAPHFLNHDPDVQYEVYRQADPLAGGSARAFDGGASGT